MMVLMIRRRAKLVFGGFVLGLVYLPAVAQQPHTLTGIVRVHQHFHSKILNNDRDVIIYLPPGYDADKNRRYSVFYMRDGQNLFDGATSYIPGQEWQVDETAERLIATRSIEPLIIVGIYNAGMERVNEYTAARDEKYKAGIPLSAHDVR
jgi:enterochelin esterase-like enzyme